MKKNQQGIVLLEALIAAVILAIGLIGAIGLQARAYGALSDSAMRAEATLAGETLFGVIQSDQGNVANYAHALGAAPSVQLKPWYDQTTNAIPGAEIVIVITAPVAPATRSTVDLTINWTRKAGGVVNTHRVTSYVAPST